MGRMGLSYPDCYSGKDPHNTRGRDLLPETLGLGLVGIPLFESLEYASLFAQPNSGARHGGCGEMGLGRLGMITWGGHPPPPPEHLAGCYMEYCAVLDWVLGSGWAGVETLICTLC
jgi:hypothetical protein